MEKGKAVYPTEIELEAAKAQGQDERLTSPHALSVSFDPAACRFTLTLLAGAMVSFSPHQVAELLGAADAQLAGVRLSPSGGALIWDELDVAIAVPGLVMDLVAGVGWQRTYRAMLMREITKAKSPAKAAAARENGKKGGRPRKPPQAS